MKRLFVKKGGSVLNTLGGTAFDILSGMHTTAYLLSRRRIRLLRAISGATICGVLAWLAAGMLQTVHQREVRHLENGGLSVPAAALHLGCVKAQREFNWIIPVRNITSEPVIVERIVASCDCVRVEPSNFRVAPGGTQQIEIVVDLSPTNERDMRAKSRSFELELRPVIGELAAPVAGWRIAGSVENVLEFTPVPVRFAYGKAIRGLKATETVQVHSDEPLEALTVKSETPFLDTAVLNGEDGRDFQLRVTTREGMSLGRQKLPLLVSGVTRDAEVLPPVALQVYATVVEDVEAVPPTIYLGSLSKGQRVEASVEVRSRSGTTFSVEKAYCQDDDLEIELADPADSARKVLHIRGHARQKEFDEHVVVVVVRSKEIKGPPYQVLVRLISQTSVAADTQPDPFALVGNAAGGG